MDRRAFLSTGLAAGTMAISMATAKTQVIAQSSGKRKFKLKYAPHFGMFRAHAGEDLVDQLKFMADEGFTAMFDNDIMGKSEQQQKAIAREMGRLGMTLGPFVLHADFDRKSFCSVEKLMRHA